MGKTVTAVVAAAGSSSRMGFDKLACPLGPKLSANIKCTIFSIL